MLKKLRERNIHLMLIFFFTGLFMGINFSFVRSAEDITFKYLDYFHFVYQTVKSEFVEKPNTKDMFQGAIRGMLSSLDDPYTRYLDEKQYAEFKEEVTGKFVGIGVEITVQDGRIVVIAPIEGTPAQKAGIQPGDIIIKINDTLIQEKNLSQVIKQIKGKPNTDLNVLIRRQGFSEPLKFTITRKPINIESVKYGLIKEQKNTGYIKITHFFDTSATDVRKALNKLIHKNIHKLVLDLRDNPGGNLEAAIQISDLFLEKGKTIVSTRGRKGSGIHEEYKAENDPLYKGKLVVLVNKGSASASEILSGALKDNKRAALIGQQTFGKALVQRLIDINPRKTGFTLTIRKYYTPSGALIHKKGIAPDIATKPDLIPKKDRKNLGRILNDNLIQQFAGKHASYTEKNITLLVQFLKEKNLPVAKKVASFYYKHELLRLKQKPLYDLEFDKTLHIALTQLNGK